MLTYLSLALISLLAFFFIYHLVPETANKQIDQILEEILGEDYNIASQKDENETEYDCDIN